VACYDAAVQAGHVHNVDNNGVTGEGVSWIESNIVNGVRQSAADAYLTPAAGRANLTVITECPRPAAARRAHNLPGRRVHHRRTDAQVLRGSRGHPQCGAVGTPRLLLLSGIGPGQHLRDVGIDPVDDVPGVGANLHDHPKAEVAYTATRPSRTTRYSRKPVVLTRTAPRPHRTCR